MERRDEARQRSKDGAEHDRRERGTGGEVEQDRAG